MAADIFVDLFTAALDVNAETLGYITGQIIYEVGEGILTAGVSKVLTLPKVILQLKAAKWMAGGGAAAGVVLTPQTIAGFIPRPEVGREFKRNEFWLRYEREYDEADLEQCELLELRPVRQVPAMFRSEPFGKGSIYLPRGSLKTGADFAYCLMNGTWWVVPDRVRANLETPCLKHVRFNSTILPR
jgi:hypothetical protein